MKFRSDELVKAYQSVKVGTRIWNEKIARLYIKRVDALYAAPNAPALSQGQSFGFSKKAAGTPLAGKYTMRLDGFWRLILSFEDSALSIVVVEEVSKHYGD